MLCLRSPWLLLFCLQHGLLAPWGAAATAAAATAASRQAARSAVSCEAPFEQGEVQALTLFQRALRRARRDLRLGQAAKGDVVASSVVKAPSRAPPQKPGARGVARSHVCLEAHLEAPYVLGLAASVDMQLLGEAGFVEQLRPCREPVAIIDASAQFPDHSRENNLAQTLAVGTMLLFAGLVFRSVVAVARVPAKGASKAGPPPERLADEEQAWAQGFFSWISMSWADDIVGRYGKCWCAVIDGEEVAWSKCSTTREEYQPYVQFRRHWRMEIEQKGIKDASMSAALFRTLGWKPFLGLLAALVLDQFISMIGSIWILEKLCNRLEAMSVEQQLHPDAPPRYMEVTLIILGLVIVQPMLYRMASILVTLLDGYYTNSLSAGVACVLFEKTLNLPVGSSPPEELAEEEDPDKNMNPTITQLINVDVMGCWEGLIRCMINLVVAPVFMVCLLVMLVCKIRLAGFLGFLYALPVAFATIALGLFSVGFWKKQQGWQDNRIKRLTETLVNIRALKSLALENLSFESLNKARLAELKYCQWNCVLGGVMMAITSTIPWGCILLALFVAEKMDGAITVTQILIVQRLMGSLLMSVAVWNMAIHKSIVAPNSFKRIHTYLCAAERPLVARPPYSQDEPIVQLRGSFAFVEGKPPVLRDLDLAFPRGELVAVIGGVASGKSAFLQAVVGELFAASEGAAVVVPDASLGKVAYCSQVPWIFEGTLRENVVLGADFDPDRYYQSLYSAALSPDLEILPGGDRVTIGSYGIRLSGGQRARVALARAAYMQTAEVVAMDDPLASLDGGTGQHVWDELILGPQLRGRTRILATQPVPGRLRRFDRVVLLEDGRVAETGTPEEVMATAAFQRLQDGACEAPGRSTRRQRGGPRQDTWTFGAEMVAQVCKQKHREGSSAALRDVETQDYVTARTVRWWLRAAGYGNLLFFLACVFVSRCFDIMQKVVMATWINHKVLGMGADEYYMMQIVYRTLAACITQVVLMYAVSRVTVAAASRVHTEILTSLFGAPIDSFFDKQPVGRLINRLTADMRQCEDSMPWVFSSVLGFVFSFIIVQGFILRVLSWRLAVCAAPFYAAALFFVYLYRGTMMPLIFHSKFGLSRVHDLQCVAISSPMSVRANGMLGEFMCKFNEQSSSIIQSLYLQNHVCAAWLQSRMFLLFSMMTTLFAMGGLWSGMPMGTLLIVIGLSSAQMSQFEGLSSLFTNALQILNALQRLTMYFDVPQEAPRVLPSDPVIRFNAKVEHSELAALDVRLPPNADAVEVSLRGDPSPLLLASADGKALVFNQGRRPWELAPGCAALRALQGGYHLVAVNSAARDAVAMAEELRNPPGTLWLDFWDGAFAAGVSVQIEELTAGYANEPPVLHGVSIYVPARAKLGLVGQTGCGKSTVLLCLLRILEARSGRIMLGDLNSAKLGLKLLRTMVGLVPQDATVFEGTWRYNIDPFGEFPSGRVWEALRCAQLTTLVASLPEGLDAAITAEGGNLSFGQRQLLSLARMAIRQPPILLLDECTSALDPGTQRTVQSTVLHEFPMSTIIAIAHRVETLLEFDRVVVLDKGKVVEAGAVKEILNIDSGLFAGMVKRSAS